MKAFTRDIDKSFGKCIGAAVFDDWKNELLPPYKMLYISPDSELYVIWNKRKIYKFKKGEITACYPSIGAGDTVRTISSPADFDSCIIFYADGNKTMELYFLPEEFNELMKLMRKHNPNIEIVV